MSAVTTVPTNPAPTDLFTLDVHSTREPWLVAAAEELWPMVVAAGGKRPDTFRVSCGWPSKGALRRASAKSRRIGECWSGGSEDGAREVFISPALAHPVEVMDVLLHEMIHAALPEGSGHGPAFARIMKVVGLEGKPTATFAGDDLVDELRRIGARLGKYPHAKLDAEMKAKQKARMMKVECPDCGYTLRTTRTWIEVGLPVCTCGTPMESVEYDAFGEPIDLLEAVVSYTTKDGRFHLSTSRTGKREARWIVREMFRPIDHETGELREAGMETIPSNRWVYRVNRTDALAFVAAVRDGLTDFPETFEHEDEDEEDFGELGDWSADDDDLYLADDEDEVHDYPDEELVDELPAVAAEMKPWERFVKLPATEEEYAKMEDLRDRSGTAKSLSIAKGFEGALD